MSHPLQTTLIHQIQFHCILILSAFSSFIADIYSRVLWCSMVDPISSIEEKQSILCEYNEYLPSLSLSLPLSTLTMIYSLERNLIFSPTNSKEPLCPRVDKNRPYLLAHRTAIDMDIKNIVKLRSACHLMVELKKRTTSHTPSSPEADKSFFSSLAFGIGFLQQLFNGWSMFNKISQYVAFERKLIWYY